MAISTVEAIKADALEFLDDTAGSRFTAPIQTWAFSMAYLTLADLFVLYEIQKVKKVTTYTLPVSTASLTPATAGIADFGEVIQLEERLSGSSDRYSPVNQVDNLWQRDSSDNLMEFEWRDDTFYFVAASTARQLQITYYASGAVPATGSVGIDGVRLLLAKLTAAFAAPRKGDPELGKDLMTQAVGPRFHEGIVGGDARRLIGPMITAQQNIPVAPRPFRAGVPTLARLGARFFVAGTTENMIPFIITGTPSGTDGTDGLAVYTLDQTPRYLELHNRGILQYPNVHYTLAGSTITFLSPYIPITGDLLLANGQI